MARFTLLVVASKDGFISRHAGESPAAWASPEEQAAFRQAVAGLDWAFMGRTTHELAYRPDRRRVVFSTRVNRPEWRGPHLWVDPGRVSLPVIVRCLAEVHPAERCGILGGTRVHDWFLAQGRIDEAGLSVEPLAFGEGLPLFTGQEERDPIEAFEARGFRLAASAPLNERGTFLHRLLPNRPTRLDRPG